MLCDEDTPLLVPLAPHYSQFLSTTLHIVRKQEASHGQNPSSQLGQRGQGKEEPWALSSTPTLIQASSVGLPGCSRFLNDHEMPEGMPIKASAKKTAAGRYRKKRIPELM